MPLQRLESLRQDRRNGVRATAFRTHDVKDADLRRRAGVDAPAKGGSQELHAETGSEVGQSGAHRVADQLLLRHEPRIGVVLVDPHRATHRDDRAVVAPVGQRLALVDLDGVEGVAARRQHRAVLGGWLAGDVLENEDVHAASLVGCDYAVVVRRVAKRRSTM